MALLQRAGGPGGADDAETNAALGLMASSLTEHAQANAALAAPKGTLGLVMWLDAAKIALRRLLAPPQPPPGALPPFDAAEAPRWAAFVLRAPALLAAARALGGALHGQPLLSREEMFTEFLHTRVLPQYARHPLVAALAAAWRDSGAAAAIAAAVARKAASADAPDAEDEALMAELLRNAMAAGHTLRDVDVARNGLRACALPSCGAREPEPRRFKACSACRAVVYCCAEHQRAHWKDKSTAAGGHKAACRAAAAGQQ
jgi:hypothetical protein